jgi:hypothetical protein
MRFSKISRVVLLGFMAAGAFAKGNDPGMPMYVLRAQTVAVMVDPDAGISLKDPNANQTAQKDVEAALTTWGRFRVVLGAEQSDLVIVLRKGSGKLAQETLPDPRQNSRPGSVTSTPGAIGVGVQHGPQPSLQGGKAPDGEQTGTSNPHPQAEGGPVEDSFAVYEGKRQEPVLDSPPAWRWVHKNGLHTHDVPAVDEFRKAIAEAEKKIAQSSKNP